MSCKNIDCQFYGYHDNDNVSCDEKIKECAIFQPQYQKEFCRHYQESFYISELRVKCHRANRHIIDSSQEVFNNAIVDAIEELQKNDTTN